MGNWKVLGEVPDSDDEALDDCSRESQEESQPRNDLVADLPSHDDLGGLADDIWDVPASFPREDTLKPAETTATPTRTQISLPIGAESDDEIDLICEDPSGRDLESSPFPSLATSARRPKDVQNNATQPEAPDAAPQPPSSPLSSLRSVSDTSPSPPPPPPRSWTPPPPPHHDRSPSPFPILPDSPPEFRLGFVRSLRPRKPIQQHPYLLENARYTRVMKSHGVKPVRVPFISEHDKAVAGDDSQEQEFAEDSQGVNQRDSTQQEDTQGALPSSSLGPIRDVLRTPSPITSTPARRLLFPSSGGSGPARTDNTSLSDEDDFPSLHSFIRRRQQNGAAAGHPDMPEETARRKRARTGESTFRGRTPSPKWIPVHVDLSPSPPGNPGHMDVYDPPDSPREAVNEGEGENESDSDVAPRSGRRIPASWLILDRRLPPDHTERATPRRAATQADPVLRKGLALPKRGGTGAAAALDFMFDESEEDDNEVEVMGSRSRTTAAEDSRPEDEPEDEGAQYQYMYESYDMDDTQSVVEEDIIDRMTTGTKRGPSRRESAAKRRRTNNPFKGIPGQKTRQPKITKMMSRSQAAPSSSSTRPDRHMHRTHSAPQRRHHLSKHAKAAARKRQPPPMLSILDFVEPQAPDFIRIAARTARSQPRLGKASPSRKVINLGSRADNIDALSVLHNWKAGKIQPRVPASQKPVRRPVRQQQSVLRELSPNMTRHASSTPKECVTMHVPEDHVPRVELPKRTIRLKPVGQRIRAREAPLRPAQLETTTPGGRLGKTYFVSRKKELDEMYRRRRRDTSVLPNVHLERFIDDNVSVVSTASNSFPVEEPTAAPERSSRDEATRRSHFRKRYDPKCVDTTAPRFIHALDPLPLELGTITEAEQPPADALEGKADKLLGLGSFGTQYSQHFDIFPLDGSVFFHRSTLLGSGRLSKALGTGTTDGDPQPTSIETPLFQLDRRDLAWDAWDDNVSSEFGILLDWLADILLPSTGTLGIHTGRKVAEAVNFVLDFIPRCIAKPGVSEAVQQSFVQRCLDVLASFAGRLEATIAQQDMQAADPVTKNNLAALSGVLLVAVWMLRICRGAPSCLGESFQTEELLKRLAKLTMRILRKCGLACVRAVYADLQQPASRAHGIRGDRQVLVSWTILMQVLGYARLPRAGFWDLAYAVLLDGFSMSTCSDAGAMERLWEDMFTLLPLGEVDSAGAVQPGLRQLVPLDGWALPRQTVSRVFALYKANGRQAPSFNAYCRAIVGRCHYLVAEWGWQQCSAIVGVIFDFYGDHDFAHLRNEEAHASPAFLEALGRAPLSSPASLSAEAAASALAIDAEDKCFHIFIKMLGLVLLRLRRLGLTNELRNLLARTLPNHNRQLPKESDVHPRDLAALRNHHDLLCTLFWASPAGLRRGVHLIEKLVTPGSAHKEACLINVRAWSQLARFVVAAGEDYGVYKGFAGWMSGIFQQVLEQHQSVEADLQRQFQQLSASMMRGISPHALRAMAAKNQAAATDVLHACVAASLDVLRHAPSLSVATYCFSGMQLETIFHMFAAATPATPDWSLLQVALNAVEHYLDRLQTAMDEQYSSTLDELANPADAHDTEEAVLMLDHRLAKCFFQCSRALMALPLPDALRPGARAACTERAVLLAGRLACRFVHAGVYRLAVFFGGGDYGLFARRPTSPLAPPRKYLPLFVSAVLENNVFDFQDVGASLLELWLLAIVAPAALLGHETRLAATLRRHDLPYVRGAVAGISASGYEANRAWFACALSSMRRSLREAEAGRRQQQLRGEFARALKRVMQQMQEDLRGCADDAASHARYVEFVRGPVALIKSHGGDICPLDAFFYQQSADYTPALDDPQLQTAGIVAYGLRLGEGEATAAPQLFHYLHNNFHIALASNQLPQTCGILARSLGASDDVLRFVLERMLPAVLRATRATPDAWPMLAVYCGALQAFLTRGAVARDVCGAGADDENGMAAAVAGVVAEVLGWLRATRDGLSETELSCAQVHVMAQLAALVGALQPLVVACLCLGGVAAGTRRMLERAVGGFGVFAARAMAVLRTKRTDRAGILGTGDDGMLSGVAGWEEEETGGQGQVDMFSKMISRHVRENWVVGAGQIAVRRAGSRAGSGVPGGGTGPGTAYGPWEMEELLEEVERQVGCWRLGVAERSRRVRRRWQ